MADANETRQWRSDRAPAQDVWDRLTPDERRAAVEALATHLPESELSPSDGTLHAKGKVSAWDALDTFFRHGRRRAFIAMDLAVYYPDAPRFAPDVLVVFDVDDAERTRWVVSQEGRGLDWVLEVHVAGDRKKDLTDHPRLYARLGIPEYFVYDRSREKIFGWRLPSPDAQRYEPVIPQQGLYQSNMLGLQLGILDGRLRFFRDDLELPESRDLAERLSRMIDERERRLDEEIALREEETRRREEETRRREEETRRREEETRRREEETRRREEAERRVAELEAELARLKKGE